LPGPPWPPGDWFIDPANAADLVAYAKQQVVVAGRSRFQEYEIFESRVWGRVLVLDQRLQSAEADERIYHEAMVQPAMVAHPDPRRVLILGGGEGATLREVLRHPQVGRAVMVDIDQELVEVCHKYLPQFHGGAFDDPRVELVFADGRPWLEGQPDGAFDVILLDLPEPLEEGPALKLFTREMYALVRRKLARQGLMAVQSGSAAPCGRLMPDLNCTLRAVFPRVVAYTAFIPSFMDLYGFHLAGGVEFFWPTSREVAARLQNRGIFSLHWFGPELAAALGLLPVYLRERLAGEGRVLTDVAPFGPGPGEPPSF
jgi:spermidine synthase